MKLMVLLYALVLPGVALAGPDRLSILLGSEHFGATEDFQEFNPGFFLTWERDIFDYSIGLYQNSYSDLSTLASIGYNTEVAPDFELGVFAALAVYPGEGDRFRLSAGDVVPLAGFQARYRYFFAQLIPSDGETADAVLAAGLTFPLE